MTVTITGTVGQNQMPGQNQVLFIVETLGYIDSIDQRRVLLQARRVVAEPGKEPVEQPVATQWWTPTQTELPPDDPRFFDSTVLPNQPIA